ncbi:MAG: SAM-dependent methyltransferase [Candidatus Thorarchaeota archaeon]
MSKWKKSEVFRKKAREAGYRSRAAFKLKEIDDRFQIFKHATRIVDLCSAPGSWLQIIRERCDFEEARIVGIDIAYIKPIQGVKIFQKSIEDPLVVSDILEFFGQPAQLVLSDCSPKLTGNKLVDRERQLWQAKLSLQLALQLLGKTGHFITKFFQSGEFQVFITEVKKHFNSVKTFKPTSSFKRSPEMYLIAKGFRGVMRQANQSDS